MFENQLFGEVGITARLALRIQTDEFDLASRHAARAIDLLYREHGGLQLRELRG
jgi:hypothetical protein